MYRCYNPKRFFFLLLLDAAAVCLWFVFSAIGRSVFTEEQSRNGILLPVVMYHNVTEHADGDDAITPEMLEADLQYLRANGYETVSAAELAAYKEGGAALPEKPVMLTFEDGFYSCLSSVLPLLEQYDMCAVVSVVGAYADAPGDPSDGDACLSWEDLSALTASGRVEIANHTYRLHSNTERAGCSIMYGEEKEAYTAMLTEDLELLQNRILEETGSVPIVFAYPYGYTCRESIPVLKELGFVCTFSGYEQSNEITRSKECLYGLHRWKRTGNTSTETFFERILAGS